MLARIALDTKCIGGEAAAASRDRREHFRSFRRCLLKHGILVSDLTREALLQAVNRLDVNERTAWKNLLSAVPMRHACPPPPAFEDLVGFGPICEAWQRFCELAVVQDDLADVLDDPVADEDLWLDPETGFELVPYGAIMASRRLQALQDGVGSLRDGEPREQVWRDLFGSLADVARHVAIADRYAVREEAKRGRSDTGLRWLLRQLGQPRDQAEPLRVTLFSAFGGRGVDFIGESQAVRMVSAAAADGAGTRIAELTVMLLDDSTFGELCHDRWVRFRTGAKYSRHYVIQLGLGLCSLSQETVRATAVSYHVADRLMDWEQRLRDAASVHRIEARASADPDTS